MKRSTLSFCQIEEFEEFEEFELFGDPKIKLFAIGPISSGNRGVPDVSHYIASKPIAACEDESRDDVPESC